MRSDLALAKLSWRELWLAGVIGLGGGLLILLVARGLFLPQGRGYQTIGPWGVPALVAALWGGVEAAGGSSSERVFTLARPVGRSRLLAVRVTVLLALTLGAGFGVDGLAWALELQRAIPVGDRVVTTLFCAAVGLAAGSLMAERAPALALAIVLGPAMVALPLGLVLVEDRVLQAFHRVGQPVQLQAGMVMLALCALVPAVLRHQTRWSPLRTARSSLSMGLWLTAGLLVSTLVVWVIGAG